MVPSESETVPPFVLFALTLLGVALFHHHTLAVALTGLAVITLGIGIGLSVLVSLLFTDEEIKITFTWLSSVGE